MVCDLKIRTASGCSFFPLTRNSTNYMHYSSWEANSDAAIQEFRYIFGNPEVHYRVHNSPPVTTIFMQSVLVSTLQFHTNDIYKPKINCPLNYHSPSLFHLFTAGVEVVYFHLITLRHTPQSIGLLRTRDRPVAETSTWQHKHSQETNIHAPGGIRTRDPSKRSAADLRLRPRGHRDRPPQLHEFIFLAEDIFLFSKTSKPALVPTQPNVQSVPGFFTERERGRGMKLTKYRG
jgi:hypothetical protein